MLIFASITNYKNNKAMKVKVNRMTVDVFEGALVKHALLRYFIRKKLDVSGVDEVETRDAYGHIIDHDAPLSEGMIVKAKVITEN